METWPEVISNEGHVYAAVGKDSSSADVAARSPDLSMPVLPDRLAMPGTEDRIRAIFGLGRGGALPAVNSATMLTYYRHLLDCLALPCEAVYSSDTGGIHPVTVTALVDPQATPSDGAALCCIAVHSNKVESLPLVDIEVEPDNPNFQSFEDYWFWYWNLRESHLYRPSKPW